MSKRIRSSDQVQSMTHFLRPFNLCLAIAPNRRPSVVAAHTPLRTLSLVSKLTIAYISSSLALGTQERLPSQTPTPLRAPSLPQHSPYLTLLHPQLGTFKDHCSFTQDSPPVPRNYTLTSMYSIFTLKLS